VMTFGMRFGKSDIVAIHHASMSRNVVNYDALLDRIIS
jgi:hypothetical protein